MESEFKFDLGTKVMLVLSEETGTVEGRAQFNSQDNQYLIRYKAGDGRLNEVWWTESAITVA